MEKKNAKTTGLLDR